LLVIGDEAGDDGRASVEGLLFVVRTRMWRGCGVGVVVGGFGPLRSCLLRGGKWPCT
jgi:hypothetical protein